MTVIAIGAPANYRKLLGKAANKIKLCDRVKDNSVFIHFFTTRRSELEKHLVRLRRKIADAGTLWVSWPKQSAGVTTDVTEDVIRAVALPLELVDVKVCAVDETWSGLKLMVRRENRRLTTA